ncbi:DUF3870 domain-containing protein [Nonomuraea sp. NPDC046802]|uniref:DUF3870 domain-containing protein n=1 Tax=Nonomuraea sp. NPDC046802 TaxID=3154919 RepID=UPI0033CA347D
MTTSQLTEWWHTTPMGARASLIVVGYAKVPRTSAVHGASEFLTVSLRIDRETGAIIEVDSTAVASMVRDWVSELLVGVDFADDIGPVLAEIDAHYLSNAAGSLKQAISDAWRRYAAYRAS